MNTWIVFFFLTVVNTAAVNQGIHLFESLISVLWIIYLGGDELDPMVILCLTF